jgi:hypothetical protein
MHERPEHVELSRAAADSDYIKRHNKPFILCLFW